MLDRRPPLAISHDGGATWREAGGGLPAGFAVAVAEDDPDRMLYAGRNRLYVSLNGGVFWRSLPFELPDVVAVAWPIRPPSDRSSRSRTCRREQ